MHPNMYASGKLCLSILGTWSGPSWTSAMSLTTIILALQSIMDDNPLKNEPGYGIGVTQKHQDYHRIIEYYNLRDFVIKTLKFTTSSEKTTNNDYLVYFKDFLVSYYLNHHLSISQRINNLAEKHPNQFSLSVSYQNVSALIDYSVLKSNWTNIFNTFTEAISK
jgi:hypothetical protein